MGFGVTGLEFLLMVVLSLEALVRLGMLPPAAGVWWELGVSNTTFDYVCSATYLEEDV